MIKGIYGINIAVKDLGAAVKKYESIFGIKSKPMGEGDFAFPGLIGAKLDIKGTEIALISYTDENTSVAKFIGSKGEGVFLISIEVDDMEEEVDRLKKCGLDFVLKDALRGAYGAVNFVHPKSAHGVQLEIYEAKR